MAGGRRIVVEFLGKDTSLGGTANQVEGRMSRLGGTLGKVAKIGGVALAGGAVVAGKALFDMGKNAMADEQAQRRLAVALRNTTGANKGQVKGVEDWISAQGVALGVTDDELRPAFQRLAQSTGSVAKAQKLSTLAMNASAGSGKSLKVVSEALAKAQAGNMGALSKLGIRIKDTEGKTMSFREVTKSMAKTFGGQASEAANSAQGKFDRLRLVLDETKETIGAKLIPVATKMADWFLKSGLPAIQQFGDWMDKNLGPVFTRIGEVISRITGGMNGDVGKNLGAVRSTFASVVSIVTSLWSRFGEFITTYLVKSLQNGFHAISGVLQIISGVFKVFASLLKGDWAGVWDGIKQILSGALTVLKALVSQALNIIKTVWQIGWSAIKGILGGIWDGIKSLVSHGAEAIVNAIRAIPGKIRDLASSFRSAGAHVISAMVDGLKNAAGIVSDIAGNIWNAVKGLLNKSIDKINAALEFKISLPGKDISINPPDIPHLARGGIVVAGDNPSGIEAIVPLERAGEFGFGTGARGGGASVVININGALDPHAVAQQVRQMLLSLKRTSGLDLGLA